MRFTIRGGTVQHGDPPLCSTCRYATIIKGTSTRHEIVECGRLSSEHNRITFPVTFCNGYVNRTHPTLREMEEIAWVLRSDPSKRQIGFVEARKLKPKDRYVLADEDW